MEGAQRGQGFGNQSRRASLGSGLKERRKSVSGRRGDDGGGGGHDATGIALCIGIGKKYKQFPKLEQAPNNAAAVGGVLEKELYYDVISASEDNSSALNKHVEELKKRIASRCASKGDAFPVLLYFSGHMGSMAGESYLLPADATPPGPQPRAAKLQWLVNELDAHCVGCGHMGFRFYCFDTAEPDAWGFGAQRTATMPVQCDKLSIVMVAQSPGLDAWTDPTAATEPVSLFTRELLPLLSESGLPVVQLITRLSQTVAAKSGSVQQPWSFQWLPAVLPDNRRSVALTLSPAGVARRAPKRDVLVLNQLENQGNKPVRRKEASEDMVSFAPLEIGHSDDMEVKSGMSSKQQKSGARNIVIALAAAVMVAVVLSG